MFTDKENFRMAKTPITTARTIAQALNHIYKTHIVINTSSFYGGEGKIVRMYTVKDAYNLGHQGYSNKELFCSASGVYVLLFLVDLLATFRGKEPEDHHNEGYYNVFARKNGQAAIDYMLNTYSEGGIEDE